MILTDKKMKLWIVLLILIVALLFLLHKPIRGFLMGHEVINEVYTGDNLLRSQEWFGRQYEEIEKQKADLKIMSNEMETDKSESLRNAYYAQIKILNGLIAEYNAKMNAIKYGKFANRDLPKRIELVEEKR